VQSLIKFTVKDTSSYFQEESDVEALSLRLYVPALLESELYTVTEVEVWVNTRSGTKFVP
jgi:hypothetical protein